MGRTLDVVSAVGFVLLGTVACQSVAEQEKVTETMTISPITTDTRAQADMLSTMGVSSMRYIADARGAIHSKNYIRAGNDLEQAQSLFQMIRHNLPSSRIKDEIWIAQSHLDYVATAKVEPDLIPIYREVSLIGDDETRAKFQATLDKTKKYLKAGKKDAAKAELSRLDDAVVLTRVSLPLDETQAQVTTAQQKLAKKDYTSADAALANAENNLRINILALVRPEPPPIEKKAE